MHSLSLRRPISSSRSSESCLIGDTTLTSALAPTFSHDKRISPHTVPIPPRTPHTPSRDAAPSPSRSASPAATPPVAPVVATAVPAASVAAAPKGITPEAAVPAIPASVAAAAAAAPHLEYSHRVLLSLPQQYQSTRRPREQNQG